MTKKEISSTVFSAWGMICPRCGEDSSIDICASVWIRLCPDGTDIAAAANGDHEWSNDAPAACAACGHEGIVKTFTAGGGA